MKSCLILMVLLLFAANIHCLNKNGYIHMQAAADQQAYLNQLIQIENNLNNQIRNFELLVNSVNNNVSSYEGLTTIQTQVLENGFEAERQLLFDMKSQLSLPLDKKTWACQMMNQAEQENLNSKISDAQKAVTALQQKMSPQRQCQKYNQINTQIQFYNQYIDHLAKQVQANCLPTPPPTPVKTVLVPYSQNKFFVYGSLGEDGYKNNLQSLLDQGYRKLQCPLEAPYPKNDTCVGCPQDKLHFYDLTRLLCLTCPGGYVFVPTNHTCLMKQMNSNSQATNYMGFFPTVDSSLETCPIDHPFFNGTHCIGCPSPAFFNFTQQSCKVCPQNTVFDLSTHLCVYKKFNSFISQNASNYCCGTLVQDPNSDTCPQDKPFFNGKQCIQCLLPAYFSLQQANCLLCPQGQSYSMIQHKCIDSKYLQPTYTSAITTAQNYMGTPPKSDQLYQNVQVCPADKPFYSGGFCIQCSLPNYFSFDDGKCLACPAQYKFDPTLHKCFKIQTTKMNNNMVVLNNFIGKVPDFNSQLATCPNDKPFFNGYQCITCTLPNYVNFDTMQCQACPSGFIFNLQSRQCLVNPPKFYTNPQTHNIFYNGDYNNIKSMIQIIRSQNSGLQECPSQTPFYNAETGACMTCPQQFPLFDIKYNRCIKCSGESVYNPESRICLMQGHVSATVQRMIMNTVGWV